MKTVAFEKKVINKKEELISKLLEKNKNAHTSCFQEQCGTGGGD